MKHIICLSRFKDELAIFLVMFLPYDQHSPLSNVTKKCKITKKPYKLMYNVDRFIYSKLECNENLVLISKRSEVFDLI